MSIKIVPMSVELCGDVDGEQILKSLEVAGRTCYKSEDKITEDSAKKFVANILKRGHESVIEHESITAKVICDRGITHEIVRHRLASYSQESTRYCDYNGGDLQFISPSPHIPASSEEYELWYNAMGMCARYYKLLRDAGVPPQLARSVLPNSLKTEIVMTMNLREWRHFFRVRCAKAAHPQMQDVANALLKLMKEKVPVIFDDF